MKETSRDPKLLPDQAILELANKYAHEVARKNPETIGYRWAAYDFARYEAEALRRGLSLPRVGA
jgi:hypothetical protein